MLIPEFKLSQTEQHLKVVIRVPYVKVSKCEFYIEENMFKFYLKPYLLTLSFDQPLLPRDEPAKATYYHEKHLLEVLLDKKNKGEFFQNLNLLSNIISKKAKDGKEKKILVEVVGDVEHQKIEGKSKVKPYSYGFAFNYEGVFKDLDEEAAQLFSFNPQNTTIKERYELSRKIAYEQFDENSYMFDTISNFEEVDRIVESKEPKEYLSKCLSRLSSNQPAEYEQFKQNLNLPKKELLLHQSDEPIIFNQLLSITVCYLYELNCMQGDMSVESAKTINKTSAVLSCFVGYESLKVEEIVIDSIRRCIVYSLYKHLDIGLKVLKQMKEFLCQNLLVHVLTHLRSLFRKSQPRYLLNTIFLDDFCIYLLTAKLEDQIAKAKDLVHNIKLDEYSLDLELNQRDELEISNIESSNIGMELEQMLKFD